MSERRLYLIDATALCYRAFYALRGLSTSNGQPTNAVYGFVNMLNKIMKENDPGYLGVCFDVSRDTFRQKKFADYKLQRPPMPDGLVSQIPLIKEIISAYAIPIFEKAGYEADDIIAAIVEKAERKGFFVTVISSDKDMLQLVNEHTVVFSPYKDKGIIYDKKKVLERFGVEPAQIPDVLALMGDDADNLPGIPGIGEKTAVELIGHFGSLEKLLDSIECVKPEKIKKSLKDNIDRARLNRELVVLDKKLELDIDLDKLTIGRKNYQELFRLFKSLEFKKMADSLPIEDGRNKENEQEVPEFSDTQLKELSVSFDELVLYVEKEDNLVFHAQGRTFSLASLGPYAKGILEDPRIKKVGHDLKKVKGLLARRGVILEGLFFDVMIAGYLLNASRPGYTLADLAWEYLSEVFSGQQIDGKMGVNLILKLKPKLEEMLIDKSLANLFSEIEMPLVAVLSEMELNGIKLDLKFLKTLSKEIEERLIQLIDNIYDISGCQFNINSPKQLREVLFEKLKLPMGKRTKTGPSTDEEVLRALAGSHKLPALLLEYRQLMKLKTTYIDTLPNLVDPDTGRVHTSFNQTATETGRLSSTNPNLQNIPIKTDIGKKIRQAIIVLKLEDDLLSCDYSQIELRVLAHFSGDKSLIDAFKSGKDIHKATAALIYGLAESEVLDSMREVAKRVNFGISYGLTPYGLSRDLGIPVDQAGQFIDAYFSRYPGVKDYMQEQISRAEKEGFVTTISGRRRYLPDINNKNQAVRQFAQRQAINTPIQGSASDLIKLAMIKIDGQIKKKRYDVKMILQIHDELVFDVPEQVLDEFADLAKDSMENVLKLNVPVIVSMKKGKNWLEMEELKEDK